jgi:hydroxymethylpyrimidine pyrophosphatase-like HAD family hydrolase
VRCLYVDLDGTLLGAGGAVTRDGEGRFTLLGVRALEACHRAQVLVVAMSGRPRGVLDEDIRLLGLDEYVFEAGAGFVVDGEVHWLTEPDTHARIAASGAPDLLLEHYAGRLEPHTPYDRGREVSHALRGLVDVAEAEALLAQNGHDDLRLIDNGEAHHHSVALADLPSVRLYHLLPAGISKPAGVAAHMRARGLTPEECVAVGDSGEDLTVAGVVGAMWLVANAFEHDPGLRPHLGRYPNARVAEATHGAGVYEAVVTTLAEGP